MAKFFTSPIDLARWVKESNSSSQEASQKIMIALGSNKNEQDIIETTKRIFSNTNVEEASKVLFDVLANYNITEENVKNAEGKCDKAITADILEKYKVITSEEKDKMIKEAQIMRQPGEYPMPLRVCPKLPFSVGKRLISTYNCRHYCLDSLVFDDDPERVYCAEALWRKHVMDKFSREWEDAKTGEYVGGYINNRFYVFPDAGTPANPDVSRYQGNRMSLKPWERSRFPRKHEWSVERRLSEQREPGSTKSITLSAAITNSQNMIKLASSDYKKVSVEEDVIGKIFSESIDLNHSGINKDDAALKLSEKYNKPIEKIVSIQTVALKKMAVHQADVYKTAQDLTQPSGFFTLPEGTSAEALVSRNGIVKKETLLSGIPLKPITSPTETNVDTFEIYNPTQLHGQPVALASVEKSQNLSSNLQSWDDIQIGAKDVGLVENDMTVVETPLPGKTAPETVAEVPAEAKA